jgi:hypothetical protein
VGNINAKDAKLFKTYQFVGIDRRVRLLFLSSYDGITMTLTRVSGVHLYRFCYLGENLVLYLIVKIRQS